MARIILFLAIILPICIDATDTSEIIHHSILKMTSTIFHLNDDMQQLARQMKIIQGLYRTGKDCPKSCQGLPGKQGIEGPEGPKGKAGLNGYPGKDGKNGLNGDHGRGGPQGPKGQAGTHGQQGQKGSLGITGPPGLRGQKGSRGQDYVQRKVAFMGSRKTLFQPSKTAVVSYDVENTDTSGTFNMHNGIFTAKQGGVYLFNFHAHDTHTNPHVDIRLKHNGKVVCSAWAGNPVRYSSNLGNSAIIYIRPGDRVYVEAGGGSYLYSSANIYTTFSGVLLF